MLVSKTEVLSHNLSHYITSQQVAVAVISTQIKVYAFDVKYYLCETTDYLVDSTVPAYLY